MYPNIIPSPPTTGPLHKASNLDGEFDRTAIVDFDACDPTLTKFDNVATCHTGDRFCRLWDSRSGRLGARALATSDGAPAVRVAVSACGQFAYIGSARGAIDMYAMQSARRVRSFETKKGYRKPIVGIASDAVNRQLVAVAVDPSIK
ncbi:hypothetical protein HK405_002463, partial [Cladochytrium tenue]